MSMQALIKMKIKPNNISKAVIAKPAIAPAAAPGKINTPKLTDPPLIAPIPAPIPVPMKSVGIIPSHISLVRSQHVWRDGLPGSVIPMP